MPKHYRSLPDDSGERIAHIGDLHRPLWPYAFAPAISGTTYTLLDCCYDAIDRWRASGMDGVRAFSGRIAVDIMHQTLYECAAVLACQSTQEAALRNIRAHLVEFSTSVGVYVNKQHPLYDSPYVERFVGARGTAQKGEFTTSSERILRVTHADRKMASWLLDGDRFRQLIDAATPEFLSLPDNAVRQYIWDRRCTIAALLDAQKADPGRIPEEEVRKECFDITFDAWVDLRPDSHKTTEAFAKEMGLTDVLEDPLDSVLENFSRTAKGGLADMKERTVVLEALAFQAMLNRDSAALEKISKFWEGYLKKEQYCVCDLPMLGVVKLANACHEAPLSDVREFLYIP